MREFRTRPGKFNAGSCESPAEKAGGKITARKAAAACLDGGLASELFTKAVEWEGSRTVAMIEKRTAGTKGEEDKGEKSRRISSLGLSPELMVKTSVAPFNVETARKILDRALFEDKREIWKGSSPAAMPLFRKIVVNALAPLLRRFKADR
jgi:hypothetical protein